MYIYIYIILHIYTYICIYIIWHIHIHIYNIAYIYTYIHIYISMCVYIYIYAILYVYGSFLKLDTTFVIWIQKGKTFQNNSRKHSNNSRIHVRMKVSMLSMCQSLKKNLFHFLDFILYKLNNI